MGGAKSKSKNAKASNKSIQPMAKSALQQSNGPQLAQAQNLPVTAERVSEFAESPNNEADITGRAQMSHAMQRGVGNARVGTMMDAAASSTASSIQQQPGQQPQQENQAQAGATAAIPNNMQAPVSVPTATPATTQTSEETAEVSTTAESTKPLKLVEPEGESPEASQEEDDLEKQKLSTIPSETQTSRVTSEKTKAASSTEKEIGSEQAETVASPVESQPESQQTPAAEKSKHQQQAVAESKAAETEADHSSEAVKAEETNEAQLEASEKGKAADENKKTEKDEKDKLDTEEQAEADTEAKAGKDKNVPDAEGGEAQAAQAGSAQIKTSEAGTQAAAGGGGGAGSEMGEAGGGGASMPGAEGGEVQGGSEEDGEAELEERLAKADPERAAADEADPADVATGEPIEEETDSDTSSDTAVEETPSEMNVAEAPATKESSEASSSEIGDTATPTPKLTPVEQGDEAAETEQSATESEAPVTDEEPATAEGFAGDEPALGGGALEHSEEAPNLSGPEKQAALESLGEGGGGDESGGGGGGGGGSAVPDKPMPEVPNVSSEAPGAALAKVGQLPPIQMKQALGGVNAAVSKSAGEEREDLAANPPEMERPTGSSRNLHGKQFAEATNGGKESAKVKQAEEGADQPTPEPKPMGELPPSPAERVSEPAVTGTENGELSKSDTSRMSNSLGSLPTVDPGSKATAGPAPQVALIGNADPAQTDDQRASLQASVSATEAQGRQDVAQEMGENTKIYPSVPPETLTAKVPRGGAGAGGAGGGEGEIGEHPEALSFIAQKQKGGEIQAAAAKAQGDLTTKKSEYNGKVGDEKAKSAKEVADLEAKSTADQAQARSDAQSEVTAKKGEWSEEQQKTVREADTEADGEVAKGRKEIQKQKKEADKEAADQVQKGDEKAESERKKAERDAAKEKKKGKKKSSGFFGWLASKAKALFNKIKAAVKAVFELARKAIAKAIELAKKAAMWAIEQARKAIVAAIKLVGKALIAIGDRLLAAFPGLRDKFRKFIQDKVDKAVNKVNEYADKLKKGVSALLDALAAGLNKLIGWLEKGMLAVVDAYAAVVDGAIKFAEKVANALGAFVVLIKHIAAGPGNWISNLAAGVVDGIKNHLWKAFKAGVQQWFNSKLEQVLGLGKMVWGLIKSGGLALATVGKMAWAGIKSMIPPTLTRILVEKLVAMIVPAAGAVMVIIEGLQAAWGAVSRIISAFQAFFGFLKSVKAGNSGPKFAIALAAAAIAVIDFVANWLIAKLAKGAAKIGGKIKGLAKKILGRKKGKARGRKAKVKKPKKAKAKKPAKKPARKPKKAKKPKKSAKDKKRDKEKKKRDKLQKRWKKGIAAVRRLLSKGGSKNIVPSFKRKLQLVGIKLRYRFRRLKQQKKGKKWVIDAWMNPRTTVDDSKAIDKDDVPLPADAGAGARKYWDTSRRGNTRLYCTDNTGSEWHYIVRGVNPVSGHWQSVKSRADIRKAEDDARAQLKSDVPELIEIVSGDKEEFAQGLDVLGIGAKENEDERLHIGEAKFGGSKSTKFLQLKGRAASDKPLSATTTSLAENIERERGRLVSEGKLDVVTKLDTLIKDGKVSLTYYLRGNVKISALQIRRVQRYVRREIGNYIRRKHGLSAKQTKKIIRQIQVYTKQI